MNKKLYWRLTDGESTLTIANLDGCFQWIRGDVDARFEVGDADVEYTLTPIWLTDEEFKNLPESND